MDMNSFIPTNNPDMNGYYNHYPNQNMNQGFSQNQYAQHESVPQQSQQQSSGMYNPEMFNNPVMTDLAMKMGTDAFGRSSGMVKEGIMNFVSRSKFKYYFAVNNSYVAKKLLLLVFPFGHRDWGTKYEQTGGPIPPMYDVNAPDLYIPFMSLITYVLVSAFVLGSQDKFTPEQLGIQTTQGLIWMFIEIIVLYISLYLLNIKSSLSYLDLIAFSGYKFVSMIVILLSFLLMGKNGFYVSFFYVCLALSFFLIRTIKQALLSPNGQSDSFTNYGTHQQNSFSKRHAYFLLILAVAQPFIIYVMTSKVIFGYLIFG